MSVCEELTRRLEQVSVELTAGLDRDGVFSDRGYHSPALALADLIGCDTGVARRRMRAGEQVVARVGLDGQSLPARLPDTAAVFGAGQVGLRHVEVIADALASPAAQRLAPQVWGGAEQQLAAHAPRYRPRELEAFATSLIAALDQDGPAPDKHEPPQLNELHLAATPTMGGGRIKGVLDAPTFDAVASALDALTAPTPDDDRTLAQRHADALGELCAHALDRAMTPSVGGERPHLNVHIALPDLEDRARNAVLDFGGALTAADLRVLACDARIIPVVLDGAGQPLDIGRARRTVPSHLRRAVAARDRGCAFPGCARPPSWCEVHHIIEWERGGTTDLRNCVMLCRIHHRLLHHPGWIVRITDGQPEFIPPKWIDRGSTAPKNPAENHHRR